MAKSLKVGDKVAWNSSGGRSVGRVVGKQTHPGKIKGHAIAASPDNPEYVVESDTSGKRAVHKPSALKRQR